MLFSGKIGKNDPHHLASRPRPGHVAFLVSSQDFLVGSQTGALFSLFSFPFTVVTFNAPLMFSGRILLTQVRKNYLHKETVKFHRH